MKSRTGLALLALLLLALAAAPRAGAGPGEPIVFDNSLGVQSSRAHSLTFDAHGTVWFAGSATDYGPAFGIAGKIGDRETLVEPAQAALAEGEPLDGIAAGPDGALWMTSPGADKVIRMTPEGALTSFSVGVAGTGSAALGGPTGIVSGPDGALWFTAEGGDAIGRITTAGEVTAFPLAAETRPRAIAAAPDGTLWFTEWKAGEIGAITTAGTVSTYPLPDRSARPNGIAVAPGGEVWFTESNSPHIGVVKASGQVVEFKAEEAGPIVYGPQGDLWFGSEYGIGSISPSGALGSTYCVKTCQADVEALGMAPNGLLWYAQHPVAHGGGGGNYIFTQTLAGSVGRYLSPFPHVSISSRAELTGRGTVRIPLTCFGDAGESCRGKSRLRIHQRVVAVAGFSLGVGRTADLILHLSPAARRLIAAGGKVESKLFLTVPGNMRVTKTFTLQAGDAHHRQARRG